MAKFALLIGVSEYSEGSFAALPAVTQDVEAMREVLQNPEIGGFEPDKIKTLINPPHPVMSETIETYFSDSVSDDLILFYFSGHGVKDEQRNLYFSAQNTRKHRDKLTTSTAVAASFVRGMMTAYKAKRKVIILDCCFSGAFGDFIGKDDGSLEIESQLGAEGTVVMTSSGSTQYSFQQKNGDLSLYTRYLVEGMRTGAADKNGDGLISVGELHDYVRGRIEEAAPALVTPKIIVLKDEGYQIHFAKAPKGDPILQYRQEVAKRAREGKFSIVARRILDRLKRELNLSSAQAEAIEGEVLQPYREYEGNLQEYEETLKEAIEEEYPLSQDILRDLKDYQHQLGLRDEDIKRIEARVIPQKVDDQAKAYFRIGLVMSDLRDNQMAINYFTQAIQLQPDYADAYYNRGSAKSNLGDKQGAIADYNQAIQLQPDFAIAYNNRGNAKSDLGDKEGAIADYQEAAKLYQQQNKIDYYQYALNQVKELQK